MNEGKFPNREFFWGVAFTIIPIWANQYTKLVMKKHYNVNKPNLTNEKLIAVSDNWLKKLSLHDF